MQTGIGDRFADRLPELRHDHLLGLIDRVKGTEENIKEQQNADQPKNPKAAVFVHGMAEGFAESGRIGSSCRMESSMMIIGPIFGNTSPMVSR